jgi:hypothetical protein
MDDSSNQNKLNPMIEKKEFIVTLPPNDNIRKNVTMEVSG